MMVETLLEVLNMVVVVAAVWVLLVVQEQPLMVVMAALVTLLLFKMEQLNIMELVVVEEWVVELQVLVVVI